MLFKHQPTEDDAMSGQSWDSMTPDQKADSLQKQLKAFIDHYNGAISRTTQRLSDLEELVRKIEGRLASPDNP